ncbi:MAG: FUSC family protein [Micrococcus sp.]|nr:FUSC family protein [Micrococcus sp.]
MDDRLATATGTVPRVEAPTRVLAVRRFLSRRSRAGWARARSSVAHAGLMAAAAVGAYWVAEAILGHEAPLFAATALLIALGFQREPQIRRVLEVSIGCTLGILIGDLLMLSLGRGMWQAAIVLFVSVMIARFLDPGPIFATQMSLQAVLVVLLPASADGPFSRSLDALVGVGFALIVTFLTPQDTRRATLRGLQDLYAPMVTVMREISAALRSGEARTAWMALVTARGTHATLESLRSELRAAREVTTFSPVERRSRTFVEAARQAVDRTDLAMRSLRIVARRVVNIVDHDALTDEDTEAVAAWFDEAADAVEVLHRAFSETTPAGRSQALHGARDALGAAAARLDPSSLGASSLHGEALVMLLRPMMVDLMEAAGSEHDDAVAHLPRV